MFEGLILGTISYASILLSWNQLPKPLRRFFRKRPLLSDVITAILTWTFISSVSKSIVAVFSVISAGLLMNLTHLVDKWINRNE